MAAYRTKFTDFDARREPKTAHFCIVCQKDLKPGQPYREVHIVSGGGYALHPEDEAAYQAEAATLPGGQHPDDCGLHPIGSDCARRLGLEWSFAPQRGAA